MIPALVPVDRVAEVWPKVAPCIARALAEGMGEYALEDVLERVTDGRWQLWIAADPRGLVAAACSEVVQYPRKRVLWVQAAGGDAGEGIAAMWPLVRRFAADNGCSALAFHGRRGWARSSFIPDGWRHAYDVIAVPVEA